MTDDLRAAIERLENIYNAGGHDAAFVSGADLRLVLAAARAHAERGDEWEYGVQHMSRGELSVVGLAGGEHGEIDDDCDGEGCFRVRRHPKVPASPWEPVPSDESSACDRGPCWLSYGHEGECEPGPSVRPASVSEEEEIEAMRRSWEEHASVIMPFTTADYDREASRRGAMYQSGYEAGFRDRAWLTRKIDS